MFRKTIYNSIIDYLSKRMAAKVLNTIEYLVLIVSEFARKSEISELEAYNYLEQYGAVALCERHYDIMHTLSPV